MDLDLSRICQAMIMIYSSWFWSDDEGIVVQSMKFSPNLNLDNIPLLTCGPLLRLCMSNVKHAYFIYITSTCIHSELWKCFMQFGIKKSHEMISYNLSWIASLGKWEHGMSTKPCNFAQMTLIGLYNKSYEGFMLS